MRFVSIFYYVFIFIYGFGSMAFSALLTLGLILAGMYWGAAAAFIATSLFITSTIWLLELAEA